MHTQKGGLFHTLSALRLDPPTVQVRIFCGTKPKAIARDVIGEMSASIEPVECTLDPAKTDSLAMSVRILLDYDNSKSTRTVKLSCASTGLAPGAATVMVSNVVRPIFGEGHMCIDIWRMSHLLWSSHMCRHAK